MKKSWLRVGLLILASASLVVGLWALPFPRSFYDDFPLPDRAWVSALGPYNEHLVRVSLVAYLAYAVPRFVFHLTKGHAFSPGDNLANMITLGLAVLLPLVLLAGSRRGGEASRDRGR